MSTPDISSLLGNYPPKTSTDRATLLDFARTTPLTYGSWKHFKQLYKLAEAPALAGEKPDVELLGILLGRIDAAPIPAHTTRDYLKKRPDTPRVYSPQAIKEIGGATFRVGDRHSSYDIKGWRLEVSTKPTVENSTIFSKFLRPLKSLLSESEKQTTIVYDFRTSSRGIANDKQVYVEENFLHINTIGVNPIGYNKINISDPNFLFIEGHGPKTATWQYMKRRARRLLRHLSESQPALYRELLQLTLRQSYLSTNRQPISPASQWLSMEALHGRSQNWKQVPASRGPYTRQQKKIEWRTRQENVPAIWEGDLQWTRQMFLDTALPPAANATALRVLQSTGQTLPDLDERQLHWFIGSNEPALQAYGTRIVNASGNFDLWSPDILALTRLYAGAKTRCKLQQFLDTKLTDIALAPNWKEAFARQLAQVLDSGKRGRRTRNAASLLGTLFPSLVSENTTRASLGQLLEYGGQERGWLFAWIRSWGQKGDLSFLSDIATLPPHWQDLVLAEFMAPMPPTRPEAGAALAMVNSSSEMQNRVAWRYLARTQIEPEAIRSMWESLINRMADVEVHKAALSEPAAVELWQRAQWQPDDVDKRLGSSYYWRSLLPFCSADFFEAFLGSLPPTSVPSRVFHSLAKLQPAIAQCVWERYRPIAQNYAPNADDIDRAFRLYSYGPWHGVEDCFVWEFLAASAVTPQELRSVWRLLWRADAPETAYSPAAAEVFARADLAAATIDQWLITAPIEKFSPQFLLQMIELVPPARKAALLQRLTPQQWQAIANRLNEQLQTDITVNIDFWNALWQSIEAQPSLLDRLGPEIRVTFNALPIATFVTLVSSATPSHEPLAMAWLEAHEQELLRDDQLETLILVASNPVAAIRLWGLRRVRERGLNVAIALRLMESGLPQPFALGREYFETAPRESQNEREYALALCDSPNAQVQQYGREFVQRRANTLLDDALLQNLLEHSDAQMQHWAAEQVAENTSVQTREFDAAVLRGRGRARRAKESVKRRLDQTTVESSTLATGALLELARGNTVRDREWALQQLAKRALSGQEIGGIVLKEKI